MGRAAIHDERDFTQRWSSVVISLGCALVIGVAATVAGAAEPAPEQSAAQLRERVQQLEQERDRLQRELRHLDQQPSGTARSVVPRSELSDQPTRSLKESLESVPGVAVTPGAGGRAVDLSIRGSGR